MSTSVSGRVGRRSPRSLFVTRLITAIALTAGAAATVPGCGGKSGGTKKVKGGDKKPAGKTAQQWATEARAAAAAGDYDTADASFKAAFAAQADFSILEEHVDMLIDARRVGPAVTVALGYYEAQPTDARGSHLYAHALIAAGDFATALQVTEELLALDDNDGAAHEKRGRALILAGKVPEGVDELRRAVQIDPKNPAFLVELGSGLHRTGQVDEAALQLRAALALDPENGRAHMLLGLALRDQAELEEAEVYLRQATKLLKDARPWFELGIVQNKRGDDLGAEESLARAIAIEPDNSLYQYAYGEMLRFNKRYDEAIVAYRTAAELDPPHPKAAAKLGVALFEAKRYGEAEVSLTESIRRDPKNQWNYFNLGIVYKETGKNKLALEMFQKFLELSDKNDGDRPKAEACVKALKKNKKC